MINILNCALALGIATCVAIYPSLNDRSPKRAVNFNNLNVYTENYSSGTDPFKYSAISDTDNELWLSYTDSVSNYMDDSDIADFQIDDSSLPKEFLLCKVASDNSFNDYTNTLMILTANVAYDRSEAYISEEGISYRSFLYLNADLLYKYDSLVGVCSGTVADTDGASVVYFSHTTLSYASDNVYVKGQLFYRFAFGFDEGFYNGAYSWVELSSNVSPWLSFNYHVYMYDSTYFYNNGYSQGLIDGYDDGYSAGYTEGLRTVQNGNALNLWMSVVDTPILMIRSLFNFDFFGVNMFIVIAGLLTALFVIFIIKKVIK